MATDAMNERIEKLKENDIQVRKKYNDVVTLSKEIEFDFIDLDGESLKTPILYGKYLKFYTDMMIELNEWTELYDKVYLERWKYYQGKQKSEYYAKYGPFNEIVTKTDLELYLKADDLLCLIRSILVVMKQHVAFLEKITKEISNRGFHIKTAVDWRKFQSGAM